MQADRVGEWRKVEETSRWVPGYRGAVQGGNAGAAPLLYVVIAALAAVLVFVLINLSGGGPQG